MKRINVTKTFLPPIDEYTQVLADVWQSGQLTNGGKYVQKLQEQLIDYLKVPYLQYVSNGTVALQLALKTLEYDDGEIITTPFSYVASTSAILWEKFTPVYVDIEVETFCIDPEKIEAAITKKTRAILAVHVFGNPCDVIAIEKIAKKYNLKVIYDAAHAFGVKYQGDSLFNYGDISTCSFHATKLFHTVEGGAVITKDKRTNEEVDLIRRFGHNNDEHYMLGINAKASELHAAMGVVNLNYINHIIMSRRQKYELYLQLLERVSNITFQTIREDTEYNFSYLPIVFNTETDMRIALDKLNAIGVFPRRYFYPSLNTIEYVRLKSDASCPVSESIAARILCLPLYVDLNDKDITKICEVISK